jgi:Ca-activated chloride channel family protein
MPLTIDYSAAKMYLTTVSPEMIPTQGTAIGQAIQVSDDAFNKKERKHKSLIIISDGEDHDEAAISRANAAFDNGVVINTIGIGSPTGSPLPDPETGTFKKDKEGNTVISRLNEEELKSIASAGRGIYEHLDNNTEEVVNSLVRKIDSMEQKEFGENIFTDYNSYYQYFLAISALLLVAEFFIPEIRRSTRVNVVTATEKP